MNIVVFFTAFLGMFLFLAVSYSQGKLLFLPNIFLTTNLIFFLSLIYITNFSEPAHLLLLKVHITAIISFSVGVFFIRIVEQRYKKNRRSQNLPSQVIAHRFVEESYYLERVFAWFLLCFSIVLGMFYYKLVGYNLVLLGLKNLLHEGNIAVDNAATLRIEAYSGSRYLAPGYFNQFKNIIAVVLWQYLFSYYVILKSKKRRFLYLFLPLLIFLLMGTGQRGAFALAVASAVLFFSKVHKKNRLKIIIVAMTIFFTFFIMTSAIIGRGVYADSGFTQIIFRGFQEINKRVFLDNAYSAQYGFEYITRNNITPQYFKETIQMLKNILPFNKQRVLTIDSEIFASKYGSRRGTSPLSAAGNVWYDARIFGVAIFYLILGIAYTMLSNYMEKKMNLFVTSCWAYAKVVLGVWLYGSAMNIIYNGIFTIILLLFINKSLKIATKDLRFTEIYISQ